MSLIVYLMWIYLITVGFSCAGIMLVMVSIKQDLKKAGYKLDFDMLNSYNGPISFQDIMNNLKVTPFVPIFNITEMAYYMKTYINDRESIYLFLGGINAIKEIDEEKQADKISEDERLEQLFEKLVKWYQITILSNKNISNQDLSTMFETLNYIKNNTNNIELLNKVYKFEQGLAECNITDNSIDNIPDSVVEKEPDKDYQKIFKHNHKNNK